MPKSKNSRRRSNRQAKKSLLPKISVKKLSKEAKADLRQFRRSIAALKKLGLAFSRTKPRSAKKSTRAKKIVTQFEDVLQGKAKVHKIGKGKQQPFAEMGYKVANGRVVIPETPKAKVYVRKGKIYRKTEMAGTTIKEEIIPVPYKSLRKYIEHLKDTNKEAPKGKAFAFRLFGSNYYNTFGNTKQLAEYFEIYEIVAWTENATEDENEEIIENLSIIEVYPNSGAARSPRRWSRNGAFSEAYRARRAFKYEQNKKRYPKQYAKMLESQRERNRENYEALKTNPEKLAERNRKKRANYAARKGKKS